LYISQPPSNPPPFNGEPDAEVLYKAMKGMGTDEKTLTQIITERTRDQLQTIKQCFEKKHNKSLDAWIKSETSGHYEEFLRALIENKADYDAKLLKESVKGLGTDDDELIEVLCTRTNGELKAMKDAYKRLFKVDAESDVKGDTSGDYKNLLMTILKADRPESKDIDLAQAKQDAQFLYSKGEGKVGTDEKAFIDILCHRSYPHLHAINDAYIQIAGHSLERGIASETSGNFKKAMIVLLTPKDEYFAKRIRAAIEGVGTDEHKLVRNLNYLADNKTLFKATNSYYAHVHKNSIGKDIAGDTSGWFKKTAVALVNNRVGF